MISVILFFVGWAVGFLIFTLVFMPLLYGVPKAAYWVAKGKLTLGAVAYYLLKFIVGNIFLLIFATAISIFVPSLATVINNDAGFFYGSWAGIGIPLLYAFTGKGRSDLNADFWSLMNARYLKSKSPFSEIVSPKKEEVSPNAELWTKDEKAPLEQSDREGLPEPERLLRQMATQGAWKNLPAPFYKELAWRLRTTQNVKKFFAFSSYYGFEKTHLPRIAKEEGELAMLGVSQLLGKVGGERLNQSQLVEAILIFSLAVLIYPDPGNEMALATALYLSERYDEALPHFERGINLFDKLRSFSKLVNQVHPWPAEFGSESEGDEIDEVYREMYEKCKKRVAASSTISNETVSSNAEKWVPTEDEQHVLARLLAARWANKSRDYQLRILAEARDKGIPIARLLKVVDAELEDLPPSSYKSG